MTILTSKQIWRRSPEPAPKPRQLGNWLNPTERENVRRAVIYLAGRYATLDAFAAALGLTRDGVAKARSSRRAQSYRLACLVARSVGVPAESITNGAWPGDRCPHCGGTGKRSQIVADASREPQLARRRKGAMVVK
jgi:hypothetical protein